MVEIDPDYFELPDEENQNNSQEQITSVIMKICEWLSENMNMVVSPSKIASNSLLCSEKKEDRKSELLYLMEYVLGVCMNCQRKESLVETILSLSQDT